MNFEKWTERAQNAVMESQNIAISLGHQQMDAEHLHLALLQQEDGIIPKLLKNMNVDPEAVRIDVNGELSKLPKVQGSDSLYSSRRMNQILMDAEKNAAQFKDEYVSVEHIYLA
ncbi:MAG: type VI secretion system ATPase TssH, partial [Firmicutes bacterium]|nr:type VI secretion system ATPase TssH [Bacillota bacterium]